MHTAARNIGLLSLATFVVGCGMPQTPKKTIDIDALVKDPKTHEKAWYCKEINIVGMMNGPEHIVPFDGYLGYVDKGKIPRISYSNPDCLVYRLHKSLDKNSKSIPVIVVLFEPSNGKVVKQEQLAPETGELVHVSFRGDLYSVPEWFTPAKMGIESEKDSKDSFVIWIDPRSTDAKFTKIKE